MTKSIKTKMKEFLNKEAHRSENGNVYTVKDWIMGWFGIITWCYWVYAIVNMIVLICKKIRKSFK